MSNNIMSAISLEKKEHFVRIKSRGKKRGKREGNVLQFVLFVRVDEKEWHFDRKR
jgi:hypothetical protein